jgi:2-(1,2-epoxy-1,2-dihydrophenyl)acetyl-CoA isomerase
LPIVTEERAGAVAILTLSKPERRNALSMQMRRELLAALERVASDGQVRAIVLTGAGGHFCSGGDLADLDVPDITAGRERFGITHDIVRRLVRSSKPVVGAVEGGCAGAGLSLALCCDTIVAAEDAKLAASFVKVGLIPDLGLIYTLPARVGEGRARQIMFYGEAIAVADAAAMGLIDHVVPAGTARTAALARAQTLTALPPLPVAAMKSHLAQGLEAALAWEKEVQAMLFLSADHAEGKAAFLEKRLPSFRGA